MLAILILVVAQASDLDTADTGTAVPEEGQTCIIEGEPSIAEWARDETGTILPEVVILAPNSADDYYVDVRLNFHGVDWYWTEGPHTPSGADLVRIPLRIEDNVSPFPTQADYTSTLTARVRDEALPGSSPRPGYAMQRLQVVFPAQGLILLDRQSAATLAPSGVYSQAERDRLTSEFDFSQPNAIVAPPGGGFERAP